MRVASMLAIGRHRNGATTVALAIPLFALFAAVFLALAYVIFLMWPRWPEAPVAQDAPSLPIVVGDALFQVPPAAIRRKVQRHAGAQDRVDLIYTWPQLKPAAVVGKDESLPPPADRIFVTVAAAPSALTSAERFRTIYPRYAEQTATEGPGGLAAVAFRDGTPYQGEDLLFDRNQPEAFLVRCTRNRGPTLGMCLHERFFGSAEVTVRFPRGWLDDWRSVLAAIDDVVGQLKPTGDKAPGS